MYRGEVLRACFRHFLLCFHFIRNLKISTQESNANSTKISIYKTQFSTRLSQQMKISGFLHLFVLRFSVQNLHQTAKRCMQFFPSCRHALFSRPQVSIGVHELKLHQ